jgi:hypothetical protein
MVEKPIDVEFSEVGVTTQRHRWWSEPYLVEDVTRIACGLALWGMAAYCIHLFLAANFG